MSKVITHNTTNLAKYVFEDSDTITYEANRLICPAFIVADLNSSNCTGAPGAFCPSMMTPGSQLGDNNGSGFGWDDMTVYKLSAEYQWNKELTLRAGWSHADQPISKDQTMMNILAPATIEDHGTIGMTYVLPQGSEISMFYMHAFEKKVKGSNSIPGAFGGGEADIKMNQNAVGIAYGWNF